MTRRRARVLGALAAALALTATGLTVRTAQLNASPAAENRALTDAEATDRAVGDVSNTLAKIFSYGPDSLDATRQDAKSALGGRAAKEYATLFAQVRERVRRQRLTLTTTVVRVGVRSLHDGTAQLLAFLDQTAARDGKKPSTTAAQLSMTAELDGGTWRITRITAR
ncbi:hypothetical protein [Streptomyces boncukensis]|uniref:Mce-associated membrane protein n=1 Tax=Streptomyces boncukensis TaxID=2711219 RepID=A0A6G4WTC7_9ACTN|nr:hypothetical protein [Streptomyces boncukensis]NGO67731.1 hypothetical protein [Streptomyces boncukensis]